jgi:creatinine amidohydrolase
MLSGTPTMAEPKVRWEELLPHEFVAARDACPVAYMAYGLTEPHGPYNAIGLDWLKAQALVVRAAQAHGGLVAPPCAWHIQEIPEFHDDGQGHGWLTQVGVKQNLASAIPSDLFYRLMLYHLRAMDARGFHAAILVTGHYGGIEKVMRKLAEFYLRQTGSPIQVATLADNEVIAPELPWRGDHAGFTETAQLMALHPTLVDLTQRRVPAELGDRFAGGVNFTADRLPNATDGERIVASQVAGLGALGQRLLAAFQPRAGWRAPDLNATEAIWQNFDRLTRPYWTLTWESYRAGKCFQFPPWEALEG